MANKYIFDASWQVALRDMNISSQDALRQARLPLDLFSQSAPTLTSEEYFRLWNSLATLLSDVPTFPLHFVQNLAVEAFSPPIFACFCSPDLNIALERLSHYKPIIGPLRLDVAVRQENTQVVIKGLPANTPPPASFMAMELALLVQIARLATRDHIVPLAVHTSIDLPAQADYEEFFGTRIIKDTFNGIVFSAEDARKPFLTASDTMWAMFEPALRTRMADLDDKSSFRERVRACLIEILASGQYSMADVAYRLAVSTRTLQRRLRDENTNFQQELDNLREELARHYLATSEYSSAQIAFLLGYQDPNSFFRAFRTWTGQTPEVVRMELQ